VVRLVGTGDSLIRRLQRSFRCVLAETTWQINELTANCSCNLD